MRLLLYSTLRNLLLAMMILHFVFRCAIQSSRIEPAKSISNDLYVTADFRASGVFLLSDCILLNRWFLVILGVITQNRFFMWLESLSIRSINSINYIYATIYIWFKTAHRKPPDKVQITSRNRSFKHFLYDCIYAVEDALQYLFHINVNICFSTSFILHQVPFLRP